MVSPAPHPFNRDALGQFINRKTFAYDQYVRPMFELRNYDSKWYYTTLRYDDFSRVEFVDRFWRPVGKEGTAFQLNTEWQSGKGVSPLVLVFDEKGRLG